MVVAQHANGVWGGESDTVKRLKESTFHFATADLRNRIAQLEEQLAEQTKRAEGFEAAIAQVCNAAQMDEIYSRMEESGAIAPD